MSSDTSKAPSETWTPMFDSVLERTGDLLTTAVYGAIWRYAQSSGRCYASYRSIARRVGLCTRTIQRHLTRLQQLELIKVIPRPGCPTLIVPLGVAKAFSHSDAEQESAVQPTPPSASKMPFAREAMSPGHTVTCDTGGQDSVAQPPVTESPTKRQLKKQKPAVPAGIRILRGICKRYPPKETWEFLSECLGPEPDRERLKECYVQWRIAGYKPTNYAWVSNWYRNGIPKHGRSRASPSVGTFQGSRIDE